MTDETPCSFEDCQHPAVRGGLCWGHVKQKQRGRRLRPLTDRHASPTARVEEAAYALADAIDNDPEAMTFASDRLRKAYQHAAKETTRQAIREGIEAAKGRGVHVGRPREATKSDEEIAAIASALGLRKAAESLGMHKDAVWRACQRVAKR